MKPQPLYKQLCQAQAERQRQLAVLLDPDKVENQNWAHLVRGIQQAGATQILVGGSRVVAQCGQRLIDYLHQHLSIPVILFPGDPSQLYPNADALLLLNLVSGRNPDYLIGLHVQAAQVLRNASFEIWPTGYLLIDGGRETAVQRVSQTTPLAQQNIELIVNTAIAAELNGAQCIYLEAGSGALYPISMEIIQAVRAAVHLPLWVGGGLRSREAIEAAYQAGATGVVIGTAFENDLNFFAYG